MLEWQYPGLATYNQVQIARETVRFFFFKRLSMIPLIVSSLNIVCTILGCIFLCLGLVSHLVQEKFLISMPVICLIAGALLSQWIFVDELLLPLPLRQSTTLGLCRLVLGVQLMFAGINLPAGYVSKEKKALTLLLGPGMLMTWLCTGLLIWCIFPVELSQAMAIAACLAPTDPILCKSIVSGRFADANIPPALQSLLLSESGANDGLGYPFLFAALYYIRYLQVDTQIFTATQQWIVTVWLWTIFLSVAYGVAIGSGARKALQFASKRGFVDHESLTFVPVALALFIIGTCGILDTDDVLAAFVTGCAFNWDDWYRDKTSKDSLGSIVDMVSNITIFLWLGAAAPWGSIWGANVAPFTHFLLAGLGILLFRRLPVILVLSRWIPQFMGWKDAVTAGFFGPMGVSAMYYLFLALDYLSTMEAPEYRTGQFKEALSLVVWFSVIVSVIVHGICIGVYQAGVGSTSAWRSWSCRISSRSNRAETVGDDEQRPLIEP